MSFSLHHSSCPEKVVQKTSVSYPQWTGSSIVDEELKSLADTWLDTAKTSAMDILSLESSPCERFPEYFNDITFEIYAPSKSMTSVLFTDLGYSGGVHGYRLYEAINFFLETGEQVELNDLFPEPGKSLPLFYSLIYHDVCREGTGHSTLPHFYGGATCQRDKKPDAPRDFLARVVSLEDLGNLVLTEKGAMVNIGPHSAWSWAEGAYIFFIPKEKLVEIGANPRLWE
jgi:hypothetical protein